MADDLSSDLASLRIDHEAGPPSSGRALKLALYAGVAVATAAIFYFIIYPNLQAKFFKTEVTVSEIALVSPAQASVKLTATGYVIAQTVSQVAAKVPGRVSEVRVKQGGEVKAGDVLLVLETIDQNATIAAAKTRVATQRANAQTARANLAEVKLQLVRARQLAKEGVAPAAPAEDLAKRVDSLKAAVKAADAAARAAQSEVAALEVNLDNYTVTAPISGKIVNKPPEVGELVGPAMTGIASQVGGIEIADFSTLAVETDVPEARLHLVQFGGPCEIILDAFPNQRFRGEAYELVPRVNRAKATVVVKVKFIDDPERVLPEMSARVSFLSGKLDADAVKEPPKLIVPGSALVERSGANVVFVLEDGKVRMVTVEVGPAFGDGFELAKGPTAGTKVVVNPGTKLADGQTVKERTE